MERRKDSLIELKQCRFCLTDDDTLQSLYFRNKPSRNNAVTLPMKILSSVSMEVFPSDKMPTYICKRCLYFMEVCYEFKQICRNADESIFKFIQSGTELEPVTWPQMLTRAFKNGQSKKPSRLKTMVEDGTRVEVTPQDMSESEEDNANVYNVKVEDGMDEESARIKVVTGNNDTKRKSKPRNKGFTSPTKLGRHLRTHAGDRQYPCKYCKKTFIKVHHYKRHLRVKHQDSQGAIEQYRCEQCEDTFGTQDELIYHSAIHATQNLTCPLCQEKFEDVDAVTAHIKSHVTEEEFMCDFCELVFTCKEKLDMHTLAAHEDELQNSMEFEENESSMDMDAEPEDAEEDDTAINIKQDGDELLLEIKKPEEFMLSHSQDEAEERGDNTNSEESEAEASYTELATVNPLAMSKPAQMPQLVAAPAVAVAAPAPAPVTAKPEVPSPAKNAVNQMPPLVAAPAFTVVAPAAPAPAPVIAKPEDPSTRNVMSSQDATKAVLKKAEIVKRKVIQQTPIETVPEKKEKPVSKENNSSAGPNDKSLRLLEKELQELKRTTNRNEIPKTPAKSVEPLRSSRRPQLHTSTPKPKPVEEKKPVNAKATEKKVPERRSTKENKEAKESKDTKTKDDSKAKAEEKEKELKEPDTPKSAVKNGDKTTPDDGPVRRSTRPSKVKDYAKMVRDRPQGGSDDDDESEDDDEEYVEEEKNESHKPRRGSLRPAVPAKPTPAKTPEPAKAGQPPPRKRGRPRKTLKEEPEVAPKMRKDEKVEEGDKNETQEELENPKSKGKVADENDENKASDENGNADASKTDKDTKKTDTVMSPTGATLKKVGTLPPGIKALPLPKGRAMGPAELCEMQIGKKVVKVQKIVMTKAEVEAMAKKGLVEMKDGTMVLKQGIKLPAKDPVAIKSSLVGEEASKESPTKKYKSAPMRCDFDDET